MDTPKEFEILIRKRVPYLTRTLFWVSLLLFSVLLLLYIFMIPATYASEEMATAYFIFLVPEWLKYLSSFSGLGLLIILPIYFSARFHKQAKLVFYQQDLTIKGNLIDIHIPFSKIEKIFCNDLHNLLRKPKGILQFVIRQRNDTVTTFRAKYYEEGEQILAAFSALDRIQLAFYEDNMVGDPYDE